MRLPLCVCVTAMSLLVGCASPTNPPAGAGLISSAVHGAVHGGQQPVAGATVTLWAAGTSGYGTGASVVATADAPTDAGGNFNFASLTCPAADTPVYLTAQGGNAGYNTNANIMLAAGLGACGGLADVSVTLNEVTTVATAFALSHFFTTTLGVGSSDGFGGTATLAEGNHRGLVMANGVTIPALVALGAGTARASGGAVTLEPEKLNHMANILAACVNSAGVTGGLDTTSACAQLFAATVPPGGTTKPTDTLQAAVQMALYPWRNVAALFNLPPAASPFVGLRVMPTDWTLGISYTAAGLGLGIAGTASSGTSSNVDIDATGRVWFPTNTAAAHGIAYFDPAAGGFSGPFATALVHPQYVAIDGNGLAWATDLASNVVASVDTAQPGTVTTYATATGSTGGPVGISSNSGTANAVLFAWSGSGGGPTVSTLIGGVVADVSATTYAPTGLAPYAYQSGPRYWEAEVASSGMGSSCLLEAPYISKGVAEDIVVSDAPGPCVSGGMAQLVQQSEESVAAATSDNKLCSYLLGVCFQPAVTVDAPEGVAVDGDTRIWVANAGNSSVSTLSYARVLNLLTDYGTVSPVPYSHAATMPMPYGLAIDRSGNVWVSNAGCVTRGATACVPGAFVLSELVGAAAPTVTPLALQTMGEMNGVRPGLVSVGTRAVGRRR